MSSEFLAFQDGDDITNGLVQFSICENGISAGFFFTLKEWQDFKEALNKFQYACDLGVVNYGVDVRNNLLICINQDGRAVDVQFHRGELFVQLYFENPKGSFTNRRWEVFKKTVNEFVPRLLEECSK